MVGAAGFEPAASTVGGKSKIFTLPIIALSKLEPLL